MGTAHRRIRRGAFAVLGAGLVTALAGWLEGWRVAVQRSPSMARTIPVGSLIVRHPVRWSALRVGQLVTVLPRGQRVPVTHRVCRLTASTLRTCNELAHVPDAWIVHHGQVLGQVVAVIPGLGTALTDPWVLLPLCVGLALALVARSARWAVLSAGWGVGLAGVAWVLTAHPLVGLWPVAVAPGPGHHHASLVAVSTALLPESVRVAGTAHRVLVGDGGVVRLVVPASEHPALWHWVASPSWVGWLVAGMVAALIAAVGVGTALVLIRSWVSDGADVQPTPLLDECVGVSREVVPI